MPHAGREAEARLISQFGRRWIRVGPGNSRALHCPTGPLLLDLELATIGKVGAIPSNFQ